MGQSIGDLFPLRLRLWLGRQLYRPLTSRVVRVSRHRLIKGPCDPREVEAMQYIAKHTTIPVPRIHAVHTTRDQQIYIEMEYSLVTHLLDNYGMNPPKRKGLGMIQQVYSLPLQDEVSAT